MRSNSTSSAARGEGGLVDEVAQGRWAQTLGDGGHHGARGEGGAGTPTQLAHAAERIKEALPDEEEIAPRNTRVRPGRAQGGLTACGIGEDLKGAAGLGHTGQ
ncbi:MAG: hypothetical protein ABW123_19235 [Cystobacter sp.]